MTVVSYRLYCQECGDETVVRKDKIEETSWKIITLYYNEGVCPTCHEGVPFESFDSIGEAGASNLRDKGIVTEEDVRQADDDEILDTAWVGEKGLQSIREEVG